MPLDTTTHLPDGLRIRVRLPHATDRVHLHAMHERLGIEVDDLELARWLRFDPRERAVVCAAAWVDGAEQLVGYGAIDLARPRPDLLVSDEALAPGVRDLLCEALREHAERAGRAA